MKDTATPLGMVSFDAVIESNLSEVVVAYRSPGSALPYPVLEATFEGAEAPSVAVIESGAQYSEIANGSDVEILALPTDAKSRREILAEWASKAAKKNKQGLVPVMLLPLAACGGGGGTPFSNLFHVNESISGSKQWIVDTDNGGIALTRELADFVFTPSSGSAVTIAAGDVAEIKVDDVALTVDADVISGLSVIGDGAVVVTNIEADTDVDLGGLAVPGVSATIDTTGGVTFLASADLGSASVTVSGDVNATTDKVAFAEGADLSGVTFAVEAGALLQLTSSQVSAVSATDTITGSGDVRIVIEDVTVGADIIERLVKVDLEGGSLTFDLQDDLDTLVLAAGSSIDLGGGTLIIDDGTVDILTNAADFTNVGNVVVNSGLTLSVSQLQQLSGKVETQGEGRLDVKLETPDDVAALKAVMANVVTEGSVPQISVGVDANSTSAGQLDTLIDATLAAELSAAAGVNVPITNSTNVTIKAGAVLTIVSASDTGASNSDGVSADTTPTINIELPSEGGVSSVLATDVVKVYLGGTLVHTLDNLSDAQASAQVTVSPVVEGSNLITAAYVRGETEIASNELRYILDTTAPSAPTISGTQGISDGIMNDADGAGSFVRVNLPSDAKKGDVVTLKLGSSSFGTTKLGASQLADGYVDFLVTKTDLGADGGYVFTALIEDVVGNVSAASSPFSLSMDTQVSAATIDAIAENDVINFGEDNSVISGTNETGATVELKFGGVTKTATVAGDKWSYTLTDADIAAIGQGTGKVIQVQQTDAAGNLSVTATRTIAVDTTAPITLTVADDGSVLSFGGTASGAINVTFDAGVASFTRGTASATQTYTKDELQLLEFDFDAEDSVALVLDLTGSDEVGEYEVKMDGVDALTITGDLGSVTGVRLTLSDVTVGSQDETSLKIDTSGVVGSNAKLTFDYPSTADNAVSNNFDNDTLTLAAGSVISSAFSIIAVDDGHVVGSGALAGGQSFTMASALTVRATDLAGNGSFSSLDESGSLFILIDSEAEVAALEAALKPSGTVTEELKYLGAEVVLQVVDDNSTLTYYRLDVESGDIYSLSSAADFPGTKVADTSVEIDIAITGGSKVTLAEMAALVEPVYFPGIPTLNKLIEQLDVEVTSNDTDIATNVTNLTNLTTLVGTITDAADGASTVGVELNALQAQLDGITGKVTDYVAAQILVLDTDLQTQIDAINSNSDLIDLNSIAELKAAVEILNGLASIEGSVADSIADAIAPLQASIDKLFALVGPDAPVVSIDNVTGNITVSVNDSDGVTSIAIYDGSTNIIDPATGEDGFVLKSGSPSTANGETTYVFELVGDVQDIPLTLTVKAVDAQGAESIAGTTVAFTAGLDAA